MTEQKETGDDALDAFFDAGRRDGPKPSEALIERIAAAAVDTLSRPVTPTPRRRGLLASIGGWPVLAGLATAAAAGVWIGYSDPALATVGLTTATDGYDLGGLLPGYLATDAWSG